MADSDPSASEKHWTNCDETWHR